MIIGIDGNEANVVNRVGIGEYAYELLLQFSKNTDHKFVIYLKSKPISDLPKEKEGWRYKVIGPKKFWTQFRLPLELFFGERPNVFFSPSHYAPRKSPVPTAISIMDLSYVRFPALFRKKDLYQLVNWTKYSAKNAGKIFTISLASKNDIIKEYKVPPEKVVVTYPGIKEEKPMPNNKSSFGDYILFVGTLQPRKNIVRLVEAFSKLKGELNLVIVGKKGWLFEEILKAPKKFSVSDRVKFLDFVKDEDMPSLYKNAVCFCLPSLYEGFGLPILEAMKYGCPVVLSNVSSLPEAGGDAAVYVDPEDVESIANGLERVVSDERLRKDLIQKGLLHVKKFSWEKTAEETLKVLEEVGV